MFAIQSFLKTASDEFELKEGEWFRSTTFLMGLDYILTKSPRALQGVDLRVYNMNDNMIYLKDLFEKLYDPLPKPRETVKLGDLSALKEARPGDAKEDVGQNDQVRLGSDGSEHKNSVSDCEQRDKSDASGTLKEEDVQEHKNPLESPPKSPKNASFEKSSPIRRKMTFSCGDSDCSSGLDFETVAEYKQHLKTRPIDHPLLLCLNTMLGLSEIDSNNERFLKRLYDLSSFVGMLGGREYKAFYFFGYDSKYFYYLDPHYVKTAHDERLSHEEYVKYYFEKTIFKMKYKSIAPSLSLCFLIQSAEGESFFEINSRSS